MIRLTRSLRRAFCQRPSAETLRRSLLAEIKESPESIEKAKLFEQNRKDVAVRMETWQTNGTAYNYVSLMRRLADLKMADEANALYRAAMGITATDKGWSAEDNIAMKRLRPGWFMSHWSFVTWMKGILYFTIRMSIFYYVIAMFSQMRGDSDNNEGGLASGFNSYQENNPVKKRDTRFSDVRGINEFRQELEDIVDLLKNGEKYKEAGAYIPKGVLLVGPPGTGKSLLAKAIAGEADCNFFYKSGSEFDEVYVGVGADRVKKLFSKARSHAPSIIFIDEIEQLTPDRLRFNPGGGSQTLNQLLTEMDGFTKLENVIVIAATNLPEKIDKAMLRPGRFDKIINIPYPDKEGRHEIFDYYLSKVKFDKEDVHVDTLVRATTGFSGAAIKNMVNIAVLNAIKEKRDKANHYDFEYALDRVVMGIGRKNMFVSEKEKLMTAYHEGGHALVNILTKSSMPLHKVTILPRGGALGFTAMLPDQDAYYMNKAEVIKQIQIALGGRIAEELVYGNDDITTGCSSDMDKATDMAFKMLREYGMNKNFLISRNKDDLSDAYNAQIDEQAQALVREGIAAVQKMLSHSRAHLDKLAHELVKRETMSRKEVEELLNIKR